MLVGLECYVWGVRLSCRRKTSWSQVYYHAMRHHPVCHRSRKAVTVHFKWYTYIEYLVRAECSPLWWLIFPSSRTMPVTPWGSVAKIVHNVRNTEPTVAVKRTGCNLVTMHILNMPPPHHAILQLAANQYKHMYNHCRSSILQASPNYTYRKFNYSIIYIIKLITHNDLASISYSLNSLPHSL